MKRPPCPACRQRLSRKNQVCPACMERGRALGIPDLVLLVKLSPPSTSTSLRLALREGGVVRWFLCERMPWPDDDFWQARRSWSPRNETATAICRWVRGLPHGVSGLPYGFGSTARDAAHAAVNAERHGMWRSELPARMRRRLSARGILFDGSGE